MLLKNENFKTNYNCKIYYYGTITFNEFDEYTTEWHVGMVMSMCLFIKLVIMEITFCIIRHELIRAITSLAIYVRTYRQWKGKSA